MKNIFAKIKLKAKKNGKQQFIQNNEKLFLPIGKILALFSVGALIMTFISLSLQVFTNLDTTKKMKYCLNAESFIYEGTVVNGYAINYNENKLLGCVSFNKRPDGKYELLFVKEDNSWKTNMVKNSDLKCTTLIENGKMALNAGCSPVSKIWQCSLKNKNIVSCETAQNPIKKSYKKDLTVIETISPSYIDNSYINKQKNRVPDYKPILERITDNIFISINKHNKSPKISIEPVRVINSASENNI